MSLKEQFKLLKDKDSVTVRITGHAIIRLKERKVKDYEKLNRKVLENIILNVIRDGKYWVGSRDIKIATKKYTLACTAQEGKLIVKTVIQTRKDFWEKFARKAKPTPWKHINSLRPFLDVKG